MTSALIIDDDIDFRQIFSLMLSDRDIAVWEVGSTKEAFQVLEEEERFDLIFSDLHLPFSLDEDDFGEYLYSEEVGIQTIGELCWVYENEVPVVAMSAAPSVDFGPLFGRVGEIPTLSKPVSREALDELLSTVLEVKPHPRPLHSHFSSLLAP